MSEMETIINRDLLKYSCGRKISCPSCGTILDYRRAVLATRSGGASGVACAPCWDKASKGRDLTGIDIIDGRKIGKVSR